MRWALLPLALAIISAAACGRRGRSVPPTTEPVGEVRPSATSVSTPAPTSISATSLATLAPTSTVSPSPQPTPTITSVPIIAEPGAAEGTYFVTNPASGARLFVRVIHPNGWDGTALPALVLVPGGIESSRFFNAADHSASALADAGYTVLIFDPDGRGQSEGRENYNGNIQQDGLAAVVRFASTLAEVESAHLGLVSFSYGVSMASGVLARHPDLPVRFLIDWEGPASREDMAEGCRGRAVDPAVDCADDAYWAEREAITFVARLRLPYQRIQSQTDHQQPDISHAIYLVNAAVEGRVPWVRLNDLEPNQTFDPANPPLMLPDSKDAELPTLIARYAQELMALP